MYGIWKSICFSCNGLDQETGDKMLESTFPQKNVLYRHRLLKFTFFVWIVTWLFGLRLRISQKLSQKDFNRKQLDQDNLSKGIVIFMPFSNPTCHFRATADFTVCTVCTWCKVSCSSEMAHMIWKWHENDTYFHQHI